VFRAVAVTLIPAVFLLLVELVLVVVGYGTPRSVFTKITGRNAYTLNQLYGWRFFPRVISRQPFPCEFAADKADNTYRIFVLGGSAAAGMPEQAFAFGRILKVMLEQNYPQTEFEVINMAMTAINSHVVRQIAGDCAGHDPDLFVVYMGNNEVVGPYGPGTVFAGFSDNLSAIRWSIAARSTRLGQLLRELGGRLGGRQRAWEGMGMFMRGRLAADDVRLEGTYAHFRQNLSDICRIADRAQAEVILCTVASNLKDNAPFVSLHGADLGGPDQQRWQELFDRGVALEETGKHSDAVEAYQAAVAIDDQFAELRFRLARCCLALGRRVEARSHFIAARDLDALRFRADTRINQTIRQVIAGESAGGGVRLADVVKAMAASDRVDGGIVGNEFFYEHVHLNYDGNYQVALAVFEALTGDLPPGIVSDSTVASVAPSAERCARRLGLTDWERHRVESLMLRMTSEPLFAGQLDHEAAQARRLKAIAGIAQRLASPDAMEAVRSSLASAMARSPDDTDLVRLMAMFLSGTGDERGASQHWRQLHSRIPNWAPWQTKLGSPLAKQGRFAEASPLLKQGVGTLPYDLNGRVTLGIALMELGDTGRAISHFRRVVAIAPEYLPAYRSLGRALLRTGYAEEAMTYLRRVVELNSSSADAQFNMGLALLAVGKSDEAAGRFREALKLDPGHIGAQKGLAAADTSGGRQ